MTTAKDHRALRAGARARADLNVPPANESESESFRSYRHRVVEHRPPFKEPTDTENQTYSAWLKKYRAGGKIPTPPNRATTLAEIERLDRKAELAEKRKKHAPSALDLERAERKIDAYETAADVLRASLEPHPEYAPLVCPRCLEPLDDDDDWFCSCRNSSSSTHERTQNA